MRFDYENMENFNKSSDYLDSSKLSHQITLHSSAVDCVCLD